MVRYYIASKEHNYLPFHNHNNIWYIHSVNRKKQTIQQDELTTWSEKFNWKVIIYFTSTLPIKLKIN